VLQRAEPWIRDLVSELGFLHASNSLDNELPYWDRAVRPKPVLALPYGFDTNDMKFFSPNGVKRPRTFPGMCLLRSTCSSPRRGVASHRC